MIGLIWLRGLWDFDWFNRGFGNSISISVFVSIFGENFCIYLNKGI
jgi:hypothetical protein